jgi:ribosomal protein S18 acetylase RimI-like enzyme
MAGAADGRAADEGRAGSAGSEPGAASAPRVVVWTGAQLRARMREAMAVYAAAMNYDELVGEQRGGFAASHSRYLDFQCRAALDGDAVVGIAYGYGSRAGQWWHDSVRRAVPPSLARDWMRDAFELSELHVLPAYQGLGIGRALLLSLVEPVVFSTVLLSTPEGPTRAFALYRRLGFVDLARNYLFAGDSRPFAVLGAQLPLAPPGSSGALRDPAAPGESADARGGGTGRHGRA